MTQEERHRLGIACKQILGNDDFRFAAGKVREACINTWMSAPLNDQEAQAAAKMAIHGLDLILSKLSAYADDAKLLDAEAQEAQEKIERAQVKKDRQAQKLKELGLGKP